MRRFHPSPRPDALYDKVLADLQGRRFRPSGAGAATELRICDSLGMDEDARTAIARLELMAKSGKIGIAGQFMPNAGVSRHLEGLGISEQVEPDDAFRFRTIVLPYRGLPARERREWVDSGKLLEDLTSPQVRRAQAALGLLKSPDTQGLVIGRHEDAESQAICGTLPGAKIVEDTTDTARLRFSPCFGVVSQPTLSPRKVTWLVQQLRMRWRDAKVRFMDTVSPAMSAREDALERLLDGCDRVLIVGETGDASCAALAEAALRKGRQARVIASASQLVAADFNHGCRMALTAGAFSRDEDIREVALALAAC